MSDPGDELNDQAKTKSWEKRVASAKRAAEMCMRFVNSPAALLVPNELRAALAEVSLLLVELAQLSHGRFDMAPWNFPDMAREHQALLRRVHALESEKEKQNGHGHRED